MSATARPLPGPASNPARRRAPTLLDQGSDDDGGRRSSSMMARGAGSGPEDDEERPPRPSFSHLDPHAGFAQIDGDVGGPGYNETDADIVTVPCPGAHPLETWARDPFPAGYFGRPGGGDGDDEPAGAAQPTVAQLARDAPLSPALDRALPLMPHVWVRQGIRRFVSTARVVLYRHREPDEHTDLVALADDLLEHVLHLREGHRQSRPLFFIAHSVGGLVVKQAIIRASQIEKYRGIWYNCHGVTFFGEIKQNIPFPPYLPLSSIAD